MVRTVQKSIRKTSEKHEKKVSKKLCKKHWKIIKKVIQNRCQNHQKTIQKSMWKKGQEKEGKALFARGGPRPENTYKSTRHIRPLKTNLDPLTRLGRLRARSGYIWKTSPPGFPGYPAGNWALEYPDSWPSHPLSLRAPIPDFQIHFSSFQVLFSALFDFWLLSDLIFQLPSSIFFLFWELVGSILA